MASPLNDIRVEEQDLSSADLTIEADTNESLEIIGIGCDSGAADEVFEVTVGETMMLAFQQDEGDDEIFPEEDLTGWHQDILGTMRDMGRNLPTIKVPEGDTFVLSDPGGNGNATVYYREGPASAWRDGADGAPEGRVRPFITQANATDTVSASSTETFAIENSVNPAQLDDWPWEEDVRADREYDMQALMLAADGDLDTDLTLDGFRLVSEETEFLARSSAFIDQANAQYPDSSNNILPFVFPTPITFAPGDDLTVEYEITNAEAATNDADINAAIIATRRDVGV